MKINLPAITFEPGLYMAATPIGNLGDISLRVLAALEQAELILAEDTRRTRKLLTHFEVGGSARLQSCHEHSQIGEKLMEQVVEIISRGGFVLFVSDAGTPLIADPGFALVRGLRAQGRNDIFALPGASAVTAALSIAALPCHRFSFGGFLPNKSGARQTYLKSFLGLEGSVVFYESPMRIEKSLRDMGAVFGLSREVMTLREMTKKFEEVQTGTLENLITFYENKKVKGELTLVVAPTSKNEKD